MGADPPSQTTASRGRAADVCIWFVSILFFLLLLAGGAMLVLYMVLPETSTTMWFPAAGMILVGIPWAFWIMTCFYRFMSWRAPHDDASPAAASAPPTTNK
ncbi:unnamed protein product [Musa acuminata subsp. burmannicoides]|nr:PREDICTED: uncharacterized protein LOC103981808 [Musa acuminata subsp. malaccensis]CAG1842461.1 unnamed protein product [Musa acuminata subsp. malaccensis]